MAPMVNTEAYRSSRCWIGPDACHPERLIRPDSSDAQSICPIQSSHEKELLCFNKLQSGPDPLNWTGDLHSACSLDVTGISLDIADRTSTILIQPESLQSNLPSSITAPTHFELPRYQSQRTTVSGRISCL